jgi:hypothetical protein
MLVLKAVMQNDSLLSTSLTNPMVLLPQSCDCSYCVRRQLLALPLLDCGNMLIYAHVTSHILTACDISMHLLTLPVPKAANFVELILPCIIMGT